MPVSQDANIDTLLQTNIFDVVISSSSLKKLIDYTEHNNLWDIPVIIKQIKINHDNITQDKTVIYIDKPFPKKQPIINDFMYKYHKDLIKTNFCKYEAFR